MFKENFLNEAQENEKIFKGILNDLKDNRDKRPMGWYIPEDLDTTSNVETIYNTYCEGFRMGIFTLLNFQILDDETAEITFENMAPLSGGGATLEYKIHDDQSVEYVKDSRVRMS